MHRRISLLWVPVLGCLLTTRPAQAQQSPASFKIATYNIQSGRGEPGLPGRPVLFTDNLNCTDPTQPLNAWGVNLVQSHLIAALSDPSVVALALQEAWACGAPANVQQVFGWKARSTERNGLAVVARHGFAGPEEWLQLDTSLNSNPADTMWVLRVPVCLDAACSASIPVYAAHWFAESDRTAPVDVYNAILRASYDRQAAQTVDFLKRTGAGGAHILIGDLNTWEGTQRVCDSEPINAGLTRLRDAAYVDAWPLVHGGAEGFTGMTNRIGCGIPEGYVWKRPDYVWSPPHFLPLSIVRFGMVPPGEASPSDHYGLLVAFPWPPAGEPPNPPPGPPTIPAGAGDIVLHATHASAIAGNWQVVPDAAAAGGARLWNPDAGAPKLAASTAPANYFELSFNADAGRAYRLWIRGKAEGNYWTNDSVSVQFSGSVNEYGAAVFRIGTSAATTVSIEEASGAGLSGWGWQDNAYGSLGPLVYFAVTGAQRIRIQQREDGISVDQVVLSPSAFLTVPPGAAKNDTTYYTESAGGSTTPPPPPPPSAEIVLHATHATTMAGTWRRETDSTAAGGARLWSPDAGLPKLAAASGVPASYFDLSFNAEAGRAYRLWIRGKAERDFWTNDSVFVQFSGSVDQAGTPVFRIGTTGATVVSVEEGSGMGLSGWGWQDNGYGGAGPLIYFAVTGPQTARIQQREDGISIDQVVLSPVTFLTLPPGAPKDDTTIYPASPGGPAPEPPPVPSPGEIVLYATHATTVAGTWHPEGDATAAGGARLWNPDTGMPKLTAASSAATSYFDLSFNAEAGRGYRLWIRGKAERDFWTNDSVFVQFSGSVDQFGSPAFRIGTTGATVVSVEEGSGMGLSGWGWQDNGYGGAGPLIYFAVTGPQTARIQQREDGISIDQVVLSSSTYLSTAPGATKNDTTILR